MQIPIPSNPTISIQGDTTIWKDIKQISLNQTFIYTLTPKLDVLISGGGSYTRREYTNALNGNFSNENHLSFDSLWLGFIHTFNSVADFVPQVKFQSAMVQRETAVEQTKNFYLKSQSLETALRGYSDPVVYAIYTEIGYNQNRNFKIGEIHYGNSIYIGGNLSIILSPKITLDLGAEQRFQTKRKINDNQSSELRSIPTFSLGSTYSIKATTAISVSSSFGGSSVAPDAIFGFTLWKKF